MKPKLQISIPKPCHEDWGKMTPDEKGRFCGSCAKSVFDFTNKTREETEEILLKNKDKKICGRFKAEMIEPAPLPLIRQQRTPLYRAFVVALFLVFGTTLFSCTDEKGETLGDIAWIENTVDGTDTTNKGVMTGDTISMVGDTAGQLRLQGEVDFQPETEPMGDVYIEPQLYSMGGPKINVCNLPDEPIQELMGKPSLQPQPEPVPLIVVKGEVKVKDPVPPVVDSMVVTQPTILPGPAPVKEPLPVDTLKIKNPNVKKVKVVFESNSVKAYPNPTNGLVNLEYTLVSDGPVLIEVLEMNGKVLRKLTESEKFYKGTYKTSFDLSDLKNGNYFFRVSSGSTGKTVKFVLAK